MVNHVITYLRNMSAPVESVYGQLYTDPQFSPVALPQFGIDARRILFGTAPDRYTVEYRLNRYVQVIENSQLREYLYEKDKRTTHKLDATNLGEYYRDVPLIVPSANNSNGATLTSFYRPLPAALAADTLGDMYRPFLIDVVSANVVTVTDLRTNGGVETVTQTGLTTNALPFTTTTLHHQISITGVSNDSWFLHYFAPLLADVSAVLTQLQTLPLMSALPDHAPYATFKYAMTSSSTLNALAGTLLALAYVAEDNSGRT